jgi:periodic tryptophan protein 2
MSSLAYTFNNLLGTVYRQGNLVFSSDGKMLYSAVGNRVSGFDLVHSKSFTFPFEARRNISRLALSPDGAILLAVDDEGHMLMANVFRRVVVHHLNLKGKVADLRFSPDGKWVAFALGRLVQVWATPALERSFTPFALHQTFGGHGDDVLSLAWSADSLFIASGGKDMTVKVHSVYKLPGYAPPSLTGHRSSIRAVFFGTDGQTIYAITRDAALSVWELQPRPDAEPSVIEAQKAQAVAEGGAGRGEEALGFWWQLTSRFYFDKDHAKVTSAVLHAPTQLLVVGFASGVFSIYDLPGGGRADGAALAMLPGEAGAAEFAAKTAAKAGADGAAPARPANGGRLQEVHSLSISEAKVDACAVSPSGEWLAFGCSQLGQLMVWEWRSESYVLKQQGHYFAEVNALAFSPGGSMIATAGGDSKVKLWSPSSGFCFVTFTEHTAPVVDLAFVPHGRALVSASLDGTVRAYDLMRYRNFQTLVSPEPCQFNCVAVEPSGEIVCAGSRDTLLIYVWNLQTGQLVEQLGGHEGPVSCLAFGGDASGGTSFLASGSWDKTVRVWDFVSSQSAVDVLKHNSDVTAIAFSPDGLTLACCTLDGQICLWDAKEAEQTGSIDGRADVAGGRSSLSKASKRNARGGVCFHSVAFTADGGAVLAGGASKFCCLYDISQRQLLRKYALSNNVALDGVRLQLHSKDLTEAGPVDDLLLDSDSDDGLAAPRSTARGVLRRSERITKLAVRASSVRFAPDGRSWAAASTEGLVIYSLDDALQFDPTGLELDTTPEAVGKALHRGEHGRALPMALCLNEPSLIRAAFVAVPPAEVRLVASALPPPYLPRLLSFLASELDGSRHLHALLLWVHQLLVCHGQRIRDHRSAHEVPLRALHKGVCARYDELAKLCHGNTFSIAFLVDQLEHSHGAASA